ncbi:DoxX family protein [Amycolatopsis aidingensis]|uniref:DoxX family protein n=1 Tax=Amycolatopsis aidingensis TaxID=2842453 RepID=UPI001C0CFDF3|nr:DoxX family protein [Amycolatopsis aidingensis]
MHTAYLIVTILAIAANAFSGIVALTRFKPILPRMAAVGVPESWLVFPIGTLKTAGALGLLAGLLGMPLVGIAAAIGLVLFWVCAVHTHLLAGDDSPRSFVPGGLFLSLAVGSLTLGIAAL